MRKVPFSASKGNGRLSKALTHIKNRRNEMFAFLEDGRCSLTNNPSENSIRQIPVGRKNWLFSKSVDGAEANMGIYTIVEMAKLYGLNQCKYLEYLLTNQPSRDMNDEELEKLAPWNEDVQKKHVANARILMWSKMLAFMLYAPPSN